VDGQAGHRRGLPTGVSWPCRDDGVQEGHSQQGRRADSTPRLLPHVPTEGLRADRMAPKDAVHSRVLRL